MASSFRYSCSRHSRSRPAPQAPAPVTSVNGRRVAVVRRRRPQQQEEQVRTRTNDPRTQLPSARARNVINRNLPISPRPTQQQKFSSFVPRQQQQPAFVPQQPAAPAFVPQQPAAPAFAPQQPAAPTFLSNAARFEGHPAKNIDLNTGSYTISY